MFVNAMPRYDVLAPEAMAVIEGGWRRLAREVGVRFEHPDAVARFRAAGQRVDDEGVVRFDPDFLLEQVARAPATITVRGRNPERALVLGGDHMVFTGVVGPPFVLEGASRRDGTFADACRFFRLAHVFDEIDSAGASPCEAGDLPLDSRHLDLQLAQILLTDKPHMGALFTGERAADGLAMGAILAGGRAALEREPLMYGVVNVNSPLRYEEQMLEVLRLYAEANQCVLITPFLLMGAMSPVTVPATLVQQTVEGLAGVAYAQLVRPGAPVVLGSFLSHTDMQSGSPGFGGPESALGLLCSGQIARRLGLPWRAGGGGLTSSQTTDVQAAYEALNTMLPAFLAGANVVLHAAGWLESGLVAGYEKFVVDIEILRILQAEFTPLQVDEESLAFGAHVEVGHAGHFLGAEHTLTRFRDCFYRPLLSSTQNYERWLRDGGRDGTARAAEHWRAALDRYEEPPIDDGVRAELEAFVTRRRRELGDAPA